MYITIDLGGTNTRVASSIDLKSFNNISKFKTHKNLNKQISYLEQEIYKLSNNHEINGICLGVPGILDRVSKVYVKLPNYTVLNNLKFKDILADTLQKNTLYVENDAVLAGLGEAEFGVGKDFKSFFYITISTGVGGAKIFKKDQSWDFQPVEPGHQIILSNHKTLENTVSGLSFEHFYRIAPQDCKDRDIWKDYAKKLNEGLTEILRRHDVEAIVMGGGMSQSLKKFKRHLSRDVRKKLIKSALEDDSGLYGGLVYLKSALAVSQ